MPCRTRLLAAQRLKETIDYVWNGYRKDCANVELRNRLVEHYTPVVQRIARKWFQHYRLRDVDAAMSDALLLLIAQIIPHFDGSGTFAGWASQCIRKKMLERRRMEMRHRNDFAANFAAADVWAELEVRHVRPDEPGADLRFADLVGRLSARSGALLWLQFYRHLSDKQIAMAMNVTSIQVRCERRRALEILRTLVDGPSRRKREVGGQKSEVSNETPAATSDL